MKRICILACAVSVLLLLLALPVSAHSGKTDASGGHYDSSTGEYHYHHGYPAHQHTNGKCPYDYKDKTDHSSGSSSNKSDSSEGASGIIWIILPLIGVGAIIAIIMFFRSCSDPGSYSQTANNFRPSAQPPKQPTPVHKATIAKAPSSSNNIHTQITPQDDEIRRLKVENASLQKSVQAKDALISEKDHKISQLQSTDCQIKIKELEAEVDSLKKDRSRLEFKLKTESENHAAAIRKKDAEIKQLNDYSKYLSDLSHGFSSGGSAGDPQSNCTSNIDSLQLLFNEASERLESGAESFFTSPSMLEFYERVSDKRFHRAMFEDIGFFSRVSIKAQIHSNFSTFYQTSLVDCNCSDFRKTDRPCKHMLYLAFHVGVLSIRKDLFEKSMNIYFDELRNTKPKK
jgi:hypothetical protein